MGFMKRLLLFAAVGTVSIVLAGCYGSPVRNRPANLFPKPNPNTTEPVPGLETTPAPLPK